MRGEDRTMQCGGKWCVENDDRQHSMQPYLYMIYCSNNTQRSLKQKTTIRIISRFGRGIPYSGGDSYFFPIFARTGVNSNRYCMWWSTYILLLSNFSRWCQLSISQTAHFSLSSVWSIFAALQNGWLNDAIWMSLSRGEKEFLGSGFTSVWSWLWMQSLPRVFLMRKCSTQLLLRKKLSSSNSLPPRYLLSFETGASIRSTTLLCPSLFG